MASNFLAGPTPPENNPPINPQYYQPGRFVISAIQTGQLTTVTTSVDHNYVIGQLVRLNLLPGNNCTGLNQSESYVISMPSANQVLLNLYSADQNAFVANAPNSNSSPQIVAIGDVNQGQINPSGITNQYTYVPGSFIDISPN